MVKYPPAKARDAASRKMPWNKKWQLAPVFLPGKFHGQRSLVSYNSWGQKESDITEYTHTHTHKLILPREVSLMLPSNHPTN